MKRLAKLLVGALWFFVCLLVGVKLFFPAEAVGQRLVYGLEESTGGGMKLVLEDVGAWTLSGVHAEEVQVLRQKKKRRRSSDEEGPPPSLFAELESISARIQLLPLLGGSKLLTLKGEAYDGSIGGELGVSGDELLLDFDADDLDLSLYQAFLPDGEALKLAGRLDLESDLHLDQEDVENSTGDVRLEIDGLAILNEAFADNFDEAVLEFDNDDGKLVVKKGSFQGEKIKATLSGDISLNKRIGKSRVDLKIKVELDTSYDLLAKASGFKRARDSEGFYHFQCTGTLERRRCRSDRQAARGKPSRSSRSRRGGGDDDDVGSERFNPDESADERRERRQKRIRERRQRAQDRRARGENGERVRPDSSRSRRGRRADRFDEPMEDEPLDEPMLEPDEEVLYEDDVVEDMPLPELEMMDSLEGDDLPFDDELPEDLADDAY